MSDGFDTTGGQGGQDKGQTAWHYGRNAEPLPELHVFSRLSELAAAYAPELARRRARQEPLQRELSALSTRLAQPLAGARGEKPTQTGTFQRGTHV